MKNDPRYKKIYDVEVFEAMSQKYSGNDCIFSSGIVINPVRHGLPEVDTVYLSMRKNGFEPSVFFLRPDELQAIAWVSNGALWSYQLNQLDSDSEVGDFGHEKAPQS